MEEKRLFIIDFPEMDEDFGLEAAVREHLEKPFSELPSDLAKWVQIRFDAVMPNVTWDQLQSWNRLNFAIRADELIKLEHVYRRRDEDKEKARRYTLAEAAKAIAQSGEREKLLLDKLCSAARAGHLVVYAPGEQASLPYGTDAKPDACWPAAEAYWVDVNSWLDRFEPRVGYRFLGPPRNQATTTQSKKSTRPKLTTEQRKEIAIRSARGESHADLAVEYDVTRQAIDAIVKKAREFDNPWNSKVVKRK